MNWLRWSDRRSGPRRRALLSPELLEDRTTPAPFVWSGLGGNALWSNGANWVGGTAPPNSGPAVDLVFPAGALQKTNTADLNSAFNITADADGYSIGGPGLECGTVAVTGAGNTLNISASLGGGSAPQIKSGAGTLVLSGDNSGSGKPWFVTGGILEAGSDTAFTRLNNNVQVFGGAVLDIHGHTISLALLVVTGGRVLTGSSGHLTLGPALGSSTSLRMTGGDINLGGPAASLTLSGDLSGDADSTGPALIDGSGSVAFPAGNHFLDVGENDFQGAFTMHMRIIAPIAGTPALTKRFAGRLEIGGADQCNLTIQNGDVETNDVSGSVGNIILDAGASGGFAGLSGTAQVGAVSGVSGAGADGTIDPGMNQASPVQTGALSGTGDFTFGPKTALNFDLVDTQHFDFLDTLTNISLGGASVQGTTGANVHPGDSFAILQATGAISGQLTGVNGQPASEGGLVLIGGFPYSVHYAAHQVVVTEQQSGTPSASQPASTTTTLVSAANPSQAGQTTTFTATVSTANPLTSGTPNGSVIFTIDGAAQPVVPLSGGTATFSTSTLTPGPHTVTASYNGNSSFASSTSSALQQIVSSGPNGVIALATPLGSVAAGISAQQAIIQPTDVNVFSFSADAGQLARFNVTHDPGDNLDSLVRLFDAAGNQLSFNDDGPTPGKLFSRDASLRYQFTQSGTYFLAVSGYPNYRYDVTTEAGVVPSDTTGSYQLAGFLALPEVDTNSKTTNAVALGAATAVRQITSFVISTPTDVDMFHFSVSAHQPVTITVTRTPGSSLAPTLRIFDSHGKQLALSNSSTLTFTFAAAGTYFVGVSGRGNASYNPVTGAGGHNGSTGSYDITLTPAGAPRQPRAHFDAKPRRPVASRPPLPAGPSIAGLIFFDQAGDGIYHPGGPVEGSHLVFIDKNNNGVQDDGEPSGITDRRGNFLLSGLTPGGTIVFAPPATQVGIAVEKIVFPDLGFYNITLSGNKRASNLVFGMRRYEG